MLKHLRIFFFAFISLTLTQSMMAADLKVYGKVSKELQFVDQDEKFNFKSHVGVVENENSESRLGAMGSHVFDDIEVKYHLELGINSSRQDKTAGTNTTTYKDTSGRIRIRQSNIKLKSYWGEFTFGQAWTPTAWLQVSVFDPLASTGAGLHALSHDTLIATPVTLLGLGTSYRGRKDGWGYETPSWAGLKFTLWTDHNDDADLDPGTGLGNEYWEYLLSYEKKWEQTHMNIYLTHRNWDAASKEDEKYNLVGWSFGYAAYSLTGSLAKSSETTIATQKENTQTYLEIGINYQICEKSKLAVTFAQRKDDDGVLDTDADVHKMNQTALGYIYQFSPHVRMHAYVYQFKYREQDSSLAQANDNTAWVGAAGGIVSF